MNTIELQIHHDRFATHVLDVICSLVIGITLGGIAVYIWIGEKQAIRFEYQAPASNTLQTAPTPHTPSDSLIQSSI